ncbi:hypothetical protein SUGI_1076920 [Cryptomeria japonica]|nr:hypothetical protein SUGI_1076920 [Cryptomeria japonica]
MNRVIRSIFHALFFLTPLSAIASPPFIFQNNFRARFESYTSKMGSNMTKRRGHPSEAPLQPPSRLPTDP